MAVFTLPVSNRKMAPLQLSGNVPHASNFLCLLAYSTLSADFTFRLFARRGSSSPVKFLFVSSVKTANVITKCDCYAKQAEANTIKNIQNTLPLRYLKPWLSETPCHLELTSVSHGCCSPVIIQQFFTSGDE